MKKVIVIGNGMVGYKFCEKLVNKTICEHFNYNRQELYDLIKINKIKSYDEALNLFGKGDDCETCKPLLASLFVSIYMETANKQVTIQDSNDRFLANIQCNGTYSIVPRVPGGEISPENQNGMHVKMFVRIKWKWFFPVV